MISISCHRAAYFLFTIGMPPVHKKRKALYVDVVSKYRANQRKSQPTLCLRTDKERGGRHFGWSAARSIDTQHRFTEFMHELAIDIMKTDIDGGHTVLENDPLRSYQHFLFAPRHCDADESSGRPVV